MNTEYPVEGVVSVWAGSFGSETEFDRSVESDVVRRLALGVPIESICEIAFESEAQPIRDMIEGFSGWQTFIAQAETAAKTSGLAAANAVLVCYYLKCQNAPELWGRLHFLGSFVGQDVR